jgi:phage shock protein E
MSGSRARRARSPKRPAGASGPVSSRATKRQDGSRRLGTWAWLGGGLVVAVLAVVLGIAVASAPSTTPTSGSGTAGTVVQGNGGTWTNISADTLATKMKAKDFTLLNVKTPYIGEIAGTDLYIPYTDLTASAAELPSDKSAPIVVYCRSGNESAIAAQALLDLGYTNIENLDGGMTAWTASGRTIVQVAR